MATRTTKKTEIKKSTATKAAPKTKAAPVKEQKKPAPKATKQAKTAKAPVTTKKVIPLKPKKEPEVIELPSIGTFPTLKKGTKETGYVTLLQTNLKNRGYYEGNVDGKFGPKTEQAVMDFQKDCKKPLNGSVGPKTWELLNNSTVMKVKPQPVIPAPVPAPAPAPGYKVIVEGLTKYQADLLIKLLQGHTECHIE